MNRPPVRTTPCRWVAPVNGAATRGRKRTIGHPPGEGLECRPWPPTRPSPASNVWSSAVRFASPRRRATSHEDIDPLPDVRHGQDAQGAQICRDQVGQTLRHRTRYRCGRMPQVRRTALRSAGSRQDPQIAHEVLARLRGLKLTPPASAASLPPGCSISHTCMRTSRLAPSRGRAFSGGEAEGPRDETRHPAWADSPPAFTFKETPKRARHGRSANESSTWADPTRCGRLAPPRAG
jgi:hypothetical protein